MSSRPPKFTASSSRQSKPSASSNSNSKGKTDIFGASTEKETPVWLAKMEQKAKANKTDTSTAESTLSIESGLEQAVLNAASIQPTAERGFLSGKESINEKVKVYIKLLDSPHAPDWKKPAKSNLSSGEVSVWQSIMDRDFTTFLDAYQREHAVAFLGLARLAEADQEMKEYPPHVTQVATWQWNPEFFDWSPGKKRLGLIAVQSSLSLINDHGLSILEKFLTLTPEFKNHSEKPNKSFKKNLTNQDSAPLTPDQWDVSYLAVMQRGPLRLLFALAHHGGKHKVLDRIVALPRFNFIIWRLMRLEKQSHMKDHHVVTESGKAHMGLPNADLGAIWGTQEELEEVSSANSERFLEAGPTQQNIRTMAKLIVEGLIMKVDGAADKILAAVESNTGEDALTKTQWRTLGEQVQARESPAILCDGCGTNMPAVKLCQQCASANFCGAECFKSVWKQHKPFCVSMKKKK